LEYEFLDLEIIVILMGDKLSKLKTDEAHTAIILEYNTDSFKCAKMNYLKLNIILTFSNFVINSLNSN
jgi:hypothetical protein